MRAWDDRIETGKFEFAATVRTCQSNILQDFIYAGMQIEIRGGRRILLVSV